MWWQRYGWCTRSQLHNEQAAECNGEVRAIGSQPEEAIRELEIALVIIFVVFTFVQEEYAEEAEVELVERLERRRHARSVTASLRAPKEFGDQAN